jgi:hypothetical protein
MYYTLVDFKYWCKDSLKMAVLCRNMWVYPRDRIFVYVKYAYTGCTYEKFDHNAWNEKR